CSCIGGRPELSAQRSRLWKLRPIDPIDTRFRGPLESPHAATSLDNLRGARPRRERLGSCLRRAGTLQGRRRRAASRASRAPPPAIATSRGSPARSDGDPPLPLVAGGGLA